MLLQEVSSVYIFYTMSLSVTIANVTVVCVSGFMPNHFILLKILIVL